MKKLSKTQIKAKQDRYKMFRFIEAHKAGVVLKQVEEEMKLTHAQTYHHIRTLENEGFIEVTKKRLPELNKVVNIVARAIARMPEAYAEVEEEKEVVAEPLPKEEPTSHVRVVRLLDNPLKPPAESKKKSKVHIGSGMTLFNNY